MRFKFVNEGSRNEVDVTYGGIKELDKLVERYVSERENLLANEDGDREYVNEFMDIAFGGITETCFCEIVFGEEDSVFIYMLKEDSLEGK